MINLKKQNTEQDKFYTEPNLNLKKSIAAGKTDANINLVSVNVHEDVLLSCENFHSGTIYASEVPVNVRKASKFFKKLTLKFVPETRQQCVRFFVTYVTHAGYAIRFRSFIANSYCSLQSRTGRLSWRQFIWIRWNWEMLSVIRINT